jgi:hypothetical protein
VASYANFTALGVKTLETGKKDITCHLFCPLRMVFTTSQLSGGFGIQL